MTKITLNTDPEKYQYEVIQADDMAARIIRARTDPARILLREKTCRKKLAIACAFMIGFSGCTWLLSVLNHPRHIINVLYLKSDGHELRRVDPNFLSVGLDSSVIAEGFKNFDMKSTRLRNMIRNLAPGYLRVGGTMADRLEFDKSDSRHLKQKYSPVQDGGSCAYELVACDPKIRPNFTLSGGEWCNLYEMADETGFKIIFDLNALIRYKDGSWNYTNAEQMIAFSRQKEMDVNWELGNEPNSFKHVFNYSVDAGQLAKDFRVLKALIKQYKFPVKPLIVGPSITRPRPENEESIDYLRKFLENGGGKAVDAITWHQYYFNGRIASVEDFVNPDIFNWLIAQIDLIQAFVGEANTQLPIWLGETAAAYGGGAPGFTNRYIGTFIWLDKLGVAAKMGIQVVVRQSIFKGFYALIDSKNYDPTPDYWISVLYKHLVGPAVLPCYLASSAEVRMYCHCTNVRHVTKPGITVYGMNMKDVDVVIRLEGFVSSPSIDTIYSYILTPRYSLLSKNIELNRKLLELGPEGGLPVFKPKVIRNTEHIVLPPYSTGFFVISTDLDICKAEFQ